MKTAFIVNISQKWQKNALEIIKVLSAFSSYEKEIFVVDKNVPDSTERHAEKIIGGQFERIAVVGGDGTLNRLINCLYGKNCLEKYLLSVIPLGTCNDFARALGFNKEELMPALKSVESDVTKNIRVAKVNGKCFLNNAGFGRKNPTAARRSAFRDLLDMQPVHFQAAPEGKAPIEGVCLMMFAANAPYFNNGLRFSGDCDPTDDILDFFFVRNISKIKLMAKLAAGRLGAPLGGSGDGIAVRVGTQKLSLRTGTPVWIMTDGETAPELSEIKEALFEFAGTCRFTAPQNR